MPSVPREWNLEGIQVDGFTVTVLLYVFAGIDVRVTLDDERADEVRPTIPTIEYVFLNVTPGQHTVDVRNVVGFTEAADVVAHTDTRNSGLADRPYSAAGKRTCGESTGAHCST